MKHIKINIEIGQLWRYKQFIYQPVEQLQRRHVVMNFRSSVLGNLLLFSSLWTKYGVTHVLYWTLLNPSTTGLKPREHIHNPPFVGAPYKVCALNVFGLSIPFLWTQYVKDTWRELLQILYRCPPGLELIRIWWPKGQRSRLRWPHKTHFWP